MSLHHLLRLLLVRLLYLLFPGVISILLRQSLVFLILLLLKFLTILLLLGDQSILLLLVFLIELRVSGIRSRGMLDRRQIFRVNSSARPRVAFRPGGFL
jgi:hypothetical protein